MRLLAITCEVLARSVYLCAARSPHVVDVRLNRRGLHDVPPDLRTLLQGQIDEAGALGSPYDAVVLAYGLCGAATAGIRAGRQPLVVPRAHDCVTLFLGDRERYQAEFTDHPGTYWFVRDYLERTDADTPFAGLGAVSDAEARSLHAAYVERYGPDNADYLMEALGAWRSHYDRAAWVEMDADDAAGAAQAERQAREEADRHGWLFERLAGDLVLVRRLLEADWDDADFLVLRPGERLAMSYGSDVIRAEREG
jgi:hypothetical protein